MSIFDKYDEARGPWHPDTIDQKPVHVGWYEVRLYPRMGAVTKRYWNGRQWCFENIKQRSAIIQNREWRGLAKEPA